MLAFSRLKSISVTNKCPIFESKSKSYCKEWCCHGISVLILFVQFDNFIYDSLVKIFLFVFHLDFIDCFYVLFLKCLETLVDNHIFIVTLCYIGRKISESKSNFVFIQLKPPVNVLSKSFTFSVIVGSAKIIFNMFLSMQSLNLFLPNVPFWSPWKHLGNWLSNWPSWIALSWSRTLYVFFQNSFE